MSLGVGLALGGFGGVLSALSGVGSGMVLVPAVAKLTSFSTQTVNGTCLAALSVGAAAGACNYSQADKCNFPLALLRTIAFVGRPSL
ncbi:4-toluene sulfonate uptake permease [Globisporangium polare]